jgi:1,4-alpha-glucan branching enzyme
MAESNKTSVVIEYSKPGAEPPIYVAGSFSSWQPLEMECTDDAEHGRKFTRKLEVEEGNEYQYKFRLGDGNWWELDESGPTGMFSPFHPLLIRYSRATGD